MANIDVQKKKANPLPWIILVIIILAAVGYFVWRYSQHPATASSNTIDTTTVKTDTIRH